MRPTPIIRRARFWWPLLLALLAASAGSAADFEFVVIGDTRPKFESESFKVFEGLIQQINQIKPALVINLGDLIYGYGLLRKEKQWDRYEEVVQAFAVPYYQLPGNHDTFSKDARRVYGRRFGKFYESFDHAGAHFVLLDNCQDGRWGYLGPTELEWLKADLHINSLRPVFVCMHFPTWESERVAPKYHAFWQQTLHPLFRGSGVKAVFGGHFHCYGPTREIDGIRYFVTGGGGAELRPDYRKAGGEHHFMRVKVTDHALDVRVVTSQGELTDVQADIMGGFLFAERHSSRIGIDRGAQDLRNGIAFSIAIQNPYKEWLTGKATWRLDASSFSVEPETTDILIRPGGTANPGFTLKALRDTATIQSSPSLEFNVAAGASQHRFHRDLLFLRQLKAGYLRKPLSLDGGLAEWTEMPRLRLGERSPGSAEVQAFHDREALYLAVSVPRPPVPVEEEEEVFPDDFQVGISRRTSDTGFGGDVVRVGLKRSGSSTEIRDRTPGHKLGGVPAGVKGASRVAGDRILFEVAIPFKLVAPLRAASRNRVVLSLSFPVPEAREEGVEPADPGLNSFSYQVRYGGDSLAPVHFVEILLEPDK